MLQETVKKHAEGQRSRKTEVSGREEATVPPAASQRRKSKAAKGGSEVDELFGRLKQARANGKAEHAQV